MTESPGKAALGAAAAELAQVEAENLAAADAADAAARAAADGGTKPPETAEKPKARKSQARQADSAPADQPGEGATFDPTHPYIYDAIRHITRTLVTTGQGWNSQFVQSSEADFAIGRMLAEGWEPIRIRSLGYTASGINMIWVLGHVKSGRGKYSEAKHITRIVAGSGLESESISGFRADEYITSFVAEGWEIATVDAIGLGPEGLTMLWVLAR